MPNVELLSRENNVASVRVALEAAEVDQVFRAVYRQLAGQMNVPGFRKGKVPPNVIRQRIGADTIRGEVDDRLREFALNHALSELKLSQRNGQPRFSTEALPAEGEALSYEFTVPVLPEIKLPEYKGMELEVTRVALDDSLRGKYRARMVDRFTTAEDKDGAAENGDLLSMDLHSRFAEGGEESPFHGHGAPYIIGREGNLPGWDEQLTGATAGQKIEFDYTMPDDFADVRVAGKALKIELKVESVKSVHEPEIDEEFVKGQLGMESVEQFDEYMDSMLQREIEMQLDQSKKEAAMARVVEGIEADISEDMIKEEIDGMVQENDRQLRQQGMSLDQYLSQKGQSLAEYRDTLREPALRKIRFFLATKAIADEQDFSASEEDFSRYAYYLMQREGIPPEQMKELMRRREFFSEAAYQIVLEKVLQHLADSAKFTVHGEPEVEPATAEAQPIVAAEPAEES